MTFEEEMDREYTEILHQKPKPGIIECACCERKWKSPDVKRVRTCKECQPHVLNRGVMGCFLTHLEGRGIYRIRLKHNPKHSNNSHLFNARPQYKDRRRRHEDIPEEGEIEDLLGEDLGIRICVDRDNE